jgi:murein L,D-transpeptidase YafK
LLVLLALFALGCPKPSLPEPEVKPPIFVEPAPPPSPPPCEVIDWVEVYKSARQLVAHCEGGAVVRMTAAMGRVPRGHKQAKGDERTPEGRYRVVGPRERSRFYGFVPIDYPSLADADAALADGRIGQADYSRIVRALALGRQPPADTPLGGEIGIHGEGQRWAGETRLLDWTYGCVAVTDADLDFLTQRLELGAIVDILP